MTLDYPYPVIVVPGIIGTYLRDDYSLPPEYVWNLVANDFGRTVLHPDDLRYEASEPARVIPAHLLEIAYKELIEELRFNLRQKSDEAVPVYPFGYDWRKPLAASEQQLADFVEEVIERTKLLRHYAKAGYATDAKVNLVGHSLGGLVIAGYLERKGPAAPVHKVVTLATPYQGSFEAVLKMITGTASLGPAGPSSREREAARLTPSLYHILPSLANRLILDPSFPPDLTLFDAAAWQPSIVASIAEFIRTHGVDEQPPEVCYQNALKLFGSLLASGAAYHQRIDGFRLEQAGLTWKNWLAVAGAGATTRVRLRVVRRGNGAADFDLRSEDRADNWRDPDSALRYLTGDGTVPLESAIPKFLGAEHVVCVTPESFGYWELLDRTLTNLSDFHATMPHMNMLHRLIVRFFTDQPDYHQNTWGWPAPGVVNWQPPLPLHEKTLA